MTQPHSFDDPAGRQLLAAIGKIRRMTSGDPKYHSDREAGTEGAVVGEGHGAAGLT